MLLRYHFLQGCFSPPPFHALHTPESFWTHKWYNFSPVQWKSKHSLNSWRTSLPPIVFHQMLSPSWLQDAEAPTTRFAGWGRHSSLPSEDVKIGPSFGNEGAFRKWIPWPLPAPELSHKPEMFSSFKTWPFSSSRRRSRFLSTPPNLSSLGGGGGGNNWDDFLWPCKTEPTSEAGSMLLQGWRETRFEFWPKLWHQPWEQGAEVCSCNMCACLKLPFQAVLRHACIIAGGFDPTNSGIAESGWSMWWLLLVCSFPESTWCAQPQQHSSFQVWLSSSDQWNVALWAEHMSKPHRKVMWGPWEPCLGRVALMGEKEGRLINLNNQQANQSLNPDLCLAPFQGDEAADSSW